MEEHRPGREAKARFNPINAMLPINRAMLAFAYVVGTQIIASENEATIQVWCDASLTCQMCK